MLRKILIQTLTIFGLTSTAMANDFYFGVSATDTEMDYGAIGIDNNGHAITLGMNLDMLSGVNTAVELSITDIVDSSLLGLSVEAETLDISVLASFGSGAIRPFGRLGFSDGDIEVAMGTDNVSGDDTTEIWGLGADYIVSDKAFIRLEMTDAEYDDDVEVEVETIRLGVFARF